MPIKRAKHKSRYLVVNNALVQDARLSWKARGIMLYLLSLPDDWSFRFSDIQERSDQDGEAALRTGLKELKDLGYLEVKRERDSEGQLGDAIWVVDENPPRLENPVLDNQELLSTHSTKYPERRSDSPTENQSVEPPYWKVTERDRPMAEMYEQVVEGIVQDDAISPGDKPHTLREWIRYVARGSNPPARLAEYVEYLYGRNKVPAFGRLGAILKRHGAQHVVEALWKAAPQAPEDPVNYAEKILSNWDKEGV